MTPAVGGLLLGHLAATVVVAARVAALLARSGPAARERPMAGRRHPGHTPGHLSLWQPDERVLITGDAVFNYDIGCIKLGVDGPDIAVTAEQSIQRLADLNPRATAPQMAGTAELRR